MNKLIGGGVIFKPPPQPLLGRYNPSPKNIFLIFKKIIKKYIKNKIYINIIKCLKMKC